jgi:hypothetical protein
MCSPDFHVLGRILDQINEYVAWFFWVFQSDHLVQDLFIQVFNFIHSPVCFYFSKPNTADDNR